MAESVYSPRLGYACISKKMAEEDVRSTRTKRLGNIESLDQLHEIGLQNLADLKQIILDNEKRGLRFFRISSELFPHAGNPKLIPFGPEYAAYAEGNIEFAQEILEEIGQIARRLGHRITCHPGQFAQLGSPRAPVVDQTFVDLQLQAQIFQYMKLEPEDGTVMIIHGGGTFGSKTDTLQLWEKNFARLPRWVSKYVVLENDEFSYSVLDLLPTCERLQIPLVVDYFHHEVMCKIGRVDFDIYDPKITERVFSVWKTRGIQPKCHLSTQATHQNSAIKSDVKIRPGTHSDSFDCIPLPLLRLCAANGMDIMIEAKNKDLCVDRLHKKYYLSTEKDHRRDWKLRNEYVALFD